MSRPSAPPPLSSTAHKGEAGRVLLLAGSASMPGAAILAARAAQRGGAGLVSVACLDPLLFQVLPPAAPEAVLIDLVGLNPVGAGRDLAAARLFARAPHAVLVGPGLGDDERTRAWLGLVLAQSEVPVVLDADALNVLALEPERLRRMRVPVVVTPHPGEAARWLGHAFPATREARLDAARELLRLSGATVVLKGKDTLVLAPRGEPWTNPSGNPGLATAGAGDVLAGLLVAYVASVASAPAAGWDLLEATRAAVYVHGLAGDLVAERLGQRALIASDLIAALGDAQRRHAAENGSA